MKSTKASSSVVVLLVGMFALSSGGCAKAKPARPAGFVEHSAMYEDPSVPFHRTWLKPGVDRRKYTKLYVAPVNVAYMLDMTEWQKGERAVGDIKKDVQDLAHYTREAVKKAVRQDPNKRFKLVDTPSEAPDTAILEIALTEVVPSKVTLNALGYAPFGIGVAVKATRAFAEDQSSVAFEARLRDGSTNETIVMAADREVEQRSLVTVRGLTWYAHAHSIIDTWAKQFVQLENRKPGEIVEDSSAITLKPW